jgi:ABC-type branched-subunit amino acid transport system ATPase component
MSALLLLRGVAKSFRGLRAVADVSLEIDANSIVALIGPNGAGKTTLFNMIAGAIAPDTGEIHFDGARVDGLRSDQLCTAGIGRTFQTVKPFTGMSVLDNVIVGALPAPVESPMLDAMPRRSSKSSASASSAICRRRHSRCPIASALKSPARSPRVRIAFCSTR